jgi:hypothetical protein
LEQKCDTSQQTRQNKLHQIPSPLKRNSKSRNLLHKATVKQEQNQIVDPAEGCISKERQFKPKQGHRQGSTLNTEGGSAGGERGRRATKGGEVARDGEVSWGRREKGETPEGTGTKGRIDKGEQSNKENTTRRSHKFTSLTFTQFCL